MILFVSKNNYEEVIKMVQITLRIDEDFIKKIEQSMTEHGYKTKSEWFRGAAREYLNYLGDK